VAGKGVAQLRAAGIQVDVGCCEEEAKQLAAPFFAGVVHARPYVTLKWAQTADGKIAGPGGWRMQISNETSSRAVHQLRANSDAILVGVNTVLADDPMLTPRGVEHARPLLRIVLDRDLRTPTTSNLVQTARNAPVLIGCRAGQAASRRADELRSLGVQIKELGSRAENLQNLLAELGKQGMTHILVETGPTLAKSFIEQNLADRVWVIRSPNRVDDAAAPAAALLPPDYVPSSEIDLKGDTLAEYLNPASVVFFAPEPSADFLQSAQKSNPLR
jgi:diaminohydroxyphosphoribosylaminopyrimidine deaminase/5-amino-6-(5-phosphoribosylamino)uracil reductase